MNAPTDRRIFLGGSNAAAVLGVGAFGETPLSVYLEKTAATPAPLDPEQEKFFRRRKRQEPVVRDMIQEDWDIDVIAMNQRYNDFEYPFLSAEIDFEWLDTTGRIQNGEIKTVHPFALMRGSETWGEDGSDEVPIHYFTQSMHGLMVTGRERCLFAVLVGVDQLLRYEVRRDDETIAGMREKLVAFWRNHIEPRVPPPPQTFDDLKALYPRSATNSIEATPKIIEEWKKLRELDGQLKAFADERAIAEFHVKEFMRDAQALTVSGHPIATWRSSRTERFQQESFKKDHPELFRQYVKPSEGRTFRIK